LLARNIEALHKLPKLQRLSFFTTQGQLSVDDQSRLLSSYIAQKQEQGSNNSLDQNSFFRRMQLFGISGRWNPPTPATTAEEFWKEYSTLSWLSRLRDSATKLNQITRNPDGTWFLDFDNNPEFSDLTLLHGAPISNLALGGTSVTDLSPLRGMPLTQLR